MDDESVTERGEVMKGRESEGNRGPKRVVNPGADRCEGVLGVNP
jgi:hypothetical protein